MPTYSYRCTECDTAFDIQQAFTDNSLTECPTCGGKLRKVFSSIGVTFNGSGFYRNDARAAAKSAQKPGGRSGKPGEKPREGASAPAAKESAPSASAAKAPTASATTAGKGAPAPKST